MVKRRLPFGMTRTPKGRGLRQPVESAEDSSAIQGADIQSNVCATPQSSQNAARVETPANKKYEERSGNVDENKRPELRETHSAELVVGA